MHPTLEVELQSNSTISPFPLQQTAAAESFHPIDLMFCASEAEWNARLRLYEARDAAARRAWHKDAGTGQREIYLLAAEAASGWIFRPANIGQLQETIRCVTHLFIAAASAGRLEAPDA